MPAEIDEETETDVWWRADFPVGTRSRRYRWCWTGGDVGYAWVNGLGLVAHDVAGRRRLRHQASTAAGPDWHLRSVVYEIFPDRYASSGRRVDRLPGRCRRDWDELPQGAAGDPLEWFGGDLPGIEAAARPRRDARRERRST